MAEIENSLSRQRQARGISAAELAKIAGVSRQTIYAMEAGSYVPNTAVALRLARALEVKVEDLFRLPGDESAIELRQEQAAMLPGSEPPVPGQPVQLCEVDSRLMASAPSQLRWYFPASDAVVESERAIKGKTKVRVFPSAGDFRHRILVAGCDPGISVLARHVHTAGIELILAHRNSSQALDLLKEGVVHVAGTHLRDDASGESNLPAIGRLFARHAVAVISFAVWEEGIVTARGNPKGIRGIEDFAHAGIRVTNREKGAGARLLLDTHLAKLGIPHKAVAGYDTTAGGHLPAAWHVQAGLSDACIATRAAARMFGLAFLPLVSERYDLAIRRRDFELASIQTLLDTLNRSSFRRELESLGGYDTRAAGQRML